MFRTTKFAVMGVALATMAMTSVACGGDDDDDMGSSSSSSGATTSSSSSGATTSSSSSSGGGGDAGTTTLYERLGKKDGIRSALGAIVSAELEDPEVASFFFLQAGAPGNGHLTPTAIIECLTNQLGQAAGGPTAEVTYPTSVDNGGSQVTCRDMATAHTGLGIYASVFDKFVGIAAGVLQSAGVAPADITTIGTVLNSTKAAIATSTRTDDAGFKDGAP